MGFNSGFKGLNCTAYSQTRARYITLHFMCLLQMADETKLRYCDGTNPYQRQ